MLSLQEIRNQVDIWRRDPISFVQDHFKVTPDKWQARALKAFASQDKSKQRIALQACAGPGKSAVLAWCGWNFLTCYTGIGEHPKGAATSVTADNLQDNLWPEFAKWQNRSELLTRLFNWNRERISHKHYPQTWFLSARSWPKTADAQEQGRTLSGFHSDYVLFLIDESGEIPLSVLQTADQALGRCEFGKIIQAGNPTSLDGMLYAASSRLSHLWHVIRITGDPDDPQRSPRIDKQWAEEQIKTYGRDNPWVKSYILGEFPPSSINTLLGPELVRDSMGKHLHEPLYDYSQRRLGIDVARQGDDRTILFPRQGLASLKTAEMRNATGPEIAARAALAKEKWQWEQCFVDDSGGFGSSVIDSMTQAGLPVVPINFSSRADDPRYFNKRSEMWFRMAEWVKRGGALPDEPDLVRELTVPTYTFVKGKFRLEEKELIKKRLGFSPDKADALVLTFAQVDTPTNRFRISADQSDHHADYDPI